MITSLLSFLKIIMIDLVMSGDNAIIIAFATKGLPKKLKKKALYAGVAGAAILRIALALVAVYILQFPLAKYVGGILLLYVAWSFFRTLKVGEKEQKVKSHTTLRSAIGVIILADVSLSLDNVLAVASVAENMWVLAIGLILSIIMMMFGSQLIAKTMEKYPIIQWFGLIVILHAALGILLESNLGIAVGSMDLSIWGLFIMGGVITYLYYKNVANVAFHLRKHHLHNNVRLGILLVTFTIFFLSDFIPEMHTIMHSNLVEWLTIVFIAYIVLVELIMQQWSIDRHYMKHQSKH